MVVLIVRTIHFKTQIQIKTRILMKVIVRKIAQNLFSSNTIKEYESRINMLRQRSKLEQ